MSSSSHYTWSYSTGRCTDVASLYLASGPEFGASFAMTSAHDVDPWLHLNSLTHDAASLGSLADQEGMLDIATDGLFPIDDFNFSEPIIGMGPHPNDIQSPQFEFDLSLLPPSLPVHDLSEPSHEMYPGNTSLSDSPSTTATL